TCSGDIIVLESTGLINDSLLPFIVQSKGLWEWAVKTSSGSLSPRTKFKSLADYKLSINFINQQENILPILNSINNSLNCIDEVINAINSIHDSVDSELGSKIFNYPKIELGELALRADDGPFGSKLKTEHYVSCQGTRVIRLQNIQEGYFDYSDKAFIDSSYANNQLSKHNVVLNDVLIAGLGDETYPVGRACIYDSEYPAINKADCFRVRVDTSMILPEFLMFILNSVHMKYFLAPFIQGVTRQRINLSNLKKLPIPLPDLDRQGEYVSLLKDIKEVSSLIHRKQLKIDELMQKIISVY
ncbi:TPA: restriction endonuclease subunit S, partial [Salmonella enterica subsp. enterica serovar Birkenhead]